MTVDGCAEGKCFTFTWKLENASYCWQGNKELLYSPKFVVDALEGTRWSLALYPKGSKDGNYIGYFLYRDKDCTSVNDIEIDYALSFMAADGSALEESEVIKRAIQKGRGYGYPMFVPTQKVFFRNRSRFLPDDTLTARCRMWRNDGKMTENGHIYARTRLGVESRSAVWNIDEFSQIEPYKAITFPIKSITVNEALMNLDLYLTGGQKFEEVLHFKLTARDSTIKMSTIQLSLLDNAGNKTECVKGEVYFNAPENLHRQLSLMSQVTRNRLMAAKDVYLPNDVLSVLCDFTFSTGVVLEELDAVRYGDKDSIPERPLANFAEDLSALKISETELFSDVKLKTKTCSFPAHKVVLNARSPVFKAMFSSDMRGSTCDSVDIRDLEYDTVMRMLRCMYTADVDDLGWSSASDLYAAADKYEILTLKKKCSSYLKTNLRPSCACEALVLADQHQDAGLKRFVQDFILKHSWEVMNSDEWKQMMETNMKLASETMYLKFIV